MPARDTRRHGDLQNQKPAETPKRNLDREKHNHTNALPFKPPKHSRHLTPIQLPRTINTNPSQRSIRNFSSVRHSISTTRPRSPRVVNKQVKISTTQARSVPRRHGLWARDLASAIARGSHFGAARLSVVPWDGLRPWSVSKQATPLAFFLKGFNRLRIVCIDVVVLFGGRVTMVPLRPVQRGWTMMVGVEMCWRSKDSRHCGRLRSSLLHSNVQEFLRIHMTGQEREDSVAD